MGILDGNGDATFTYTAGEVGGQERIIISAPELSPSGGYGDAVVLVSVVGLSRLGPSVDYFLVGETPEHPSNHYGSSLLRQEIPAVARAYMDEYDAFLRVDDMILINGGMFDVCATWNVNDVCAKVPNGGHLTHRDGKNVDFGYYHMINGQPRRVSDMVERLGNLLIANPEINCQTTYEGSHLECPKRD